MLSQIHSIHILLCDEIDDRFEDASDIATTEKFRRVKIGSGINVDNGTISVPIIGLASKEEFGSVKIGDGLTADNGVISTLPHQHADHENFGIIKPSSDFEFGSDGSLQLAMRNESIQASAIEIVRNGVIKVVPNRIRYRAFINADTLLSFDFGDFVPESDIAFKLEIVSKGNYVINCSSGHEPVNTFDGNKDTRWATVNGGAIGGWIQVKFSAETLCIKVWLRARTDNWDVQPPTSFEISVSNDGVSFDVVKTVTDKSWEQGEQKEYEFDLEDPMARPLSPQLKRKISFIHLSAC